MKRTLAAAPALALVALSFGLGAQPAAADELPLPVPTTIVDDLTGLLALPTASPSPTPPLLPVPLLPAPLPTAAPTPVLGTTTTSGTTAVAAAPRVHSAGGSLPVVAPAVAPAASSMTGTAPGVQLSSATMPAWASAYTGLNAAPTLAKGVLPLPLSASSARGSAPVAPSSLPGGAAALAVAVLVVTAGGHVLLRRGALPLR